MNPILNKTYYVAALLVIAGILLFVSQNDMAVPVFITGTILFAGIRIISAIKNKDKGTSRIPYVQLLSASSLVFSSYMMYKGSNSWAVFALITAVLESYSTFRINKQE